MYKERLYLIALDIFVYLEYLQLRIIWDRIEHDTQVRVVQSPVNAPFQVIGQQTLSVELLLQ